MGWLIMTIDDYYLDKQQNSYLIGRNENGEFWCCDEFDTLEEAKNTLRHILYENKEYFIVEKTLSFKKLNVDICL